MSAGPTAPSADTAAATLRERSLRLPRQVYRLRTLGLVVGAFAVAAVFYENRAPWLAWALLIFHVGLWPHLAWLRARRSADPHVAERVNLTVDSAFGGVYIALMHFNLLPSVLIAAMKSMDKIGWGPQFLARTTAAMAAGCAVTMIFTRAAFQPHTSMRDYARRRVEELADDELAGFVLKKDSPTCGLERVKVYGTAGMPVKSGRGLFAQALVARFPLLPIEEEGRLNDPRLRENFVERIFAYRRLRALFASRWSMGAVVRFHTAHKLTLMAHMPEAYRRLGRLVASGSSMNRREFEDRYSSDFMTALRTIATPRRQINVLQHMLGYFKQPLDRDSRAELLALIQDYGRGRVPLVVPLTLFAHHIRRCGVPYLAGQVYLQPHPVELMLRNQV